MKAAASLRTGEYLRMPTGPWKLRDQRWDRYRVLSFAWPDVSHAVLGFWEDATDRFVGWYVNLQAPLRRTVFGFDTVDHFLDVVISPDLETWAWKDEDELAEAERLGLISPGDVVSIRAEGERALERLERRGAPFDRDWSAWRPDRGVMRAYKKGGRFLSTTRAWVADNRKLRDHVLREVRRGGPVPTNQFTDLSERSYRSGGWNDERNVGRMLDALWTEGRIMVSYRDGLRRFWDLSERVLPEWTPREPMSETAVWRRRSDLALRALGIGTAKHVQNHFMRW